VTELARNAEEKSARKLNSSELFNVRHIAWDLLKLRAHGVDGMPGISLDELEEQSGLSKDVLKEQVLKGWTVAERDPDIWLAPEVIARRLPKAPKSR
jgi:hypothetical protein